MSNETASTHSLLITYTLYSSLFKRKYLTQADLSFQGNDRLSIMKYAMALFLLCARLTGFAQNDSLTLYAYEQKVSPGIAPVETSQAHTQHLIFLLTPVNKAVDPVSLWIKGKLFGVNVKETKAPVQQQSASDSTIVLVPETDQQVLRLFPTKSTTPGKEQKGASLARQNELVLVYKLNGKLHYIVKKRIDQLEPVNMQ